MSSKVNELQVEAKAYMKECKRLRAVAERAVLMSGEIDLKNCKAQALELQA